MGELGESKKLLKTAKENIGRSHRREKSKQFPPANGSVSMEGYVAVGEVVEEDAQAPGSSR